MCGVTMRIVRVFCLMAMAALSAACAQEVNASRAEIASVRYVADEAPYIALLTMVNDKSQRGAHSALLINASERVIYDPAGTFAHSTLAEKGDIQYGVTDQALQFYKRYHARDSHFVHTQKLNVSAELAEAVLRRAQLQGPSPKMFCTINTAQILQDIPQFSFIKPGFYPEGLRKQFATIPGIENSYLRESDHGKLVPTN